MITTTVRATPSAPPPSSSAPADENEDKTESSGEDFAALLAGSWFTLQENKPLNRNADAGTAEASSLSIDGALSPPLNTELVAAQNLAPANVNLQAGEAVDETMLAALQTTEQNTQTIPSAEGLNAASLPAGAESIAALNQTRVEAQNAQIQAQAAEKNFALQLAENVEAAQRDTQTVKSLHAEAAQRDSATLASLLAAATREHRPAVNATLLKPLMADRTPLTAERDQGPIESPLAEQTPAATILDYSTLRRAASGAATEISAAAREVVGQVAEPVVNLFERLGERESRTLNLRLRPESLGQVDVRLTREAGGNLSAHLVADHDAARRALHEGINHLRETLEQAGINVTRLEVSVGGNGQFGQTGNQSSRTFEALPAPPGSPLVATGANTTITHAAPDAEDRAVSLRA
ncbi:MAG TPA: flagellar hook-length control protein FliK [Pyrinomonadaceae bacterium]|jgi:flagellar hook-length control protein FliK|nr:flagellar hook-length control protein FliK [Pyrinomonadaceae bacterium]